ncbi:MAG: filamentous hemagglutinin N-terminal domain-containing protein [Vampirovibrio sp.]|nr:filamentous hemagglutinin N-terminal domain-containing protein [Vampirovibrio sp.]
MNRSTFFSNTTAIFSVVLASSISISAWADPTLPTGFDPSLSTGVNSVTTTGNTQTILTDATRSVGSFGNFSIGQGYTVNVNQPNAASSFLAVSRDSSPSLIYGALNSNGAVWVANPYGVFVGPTGVISVAGFLGASQQISASDFLNNTVKFNNLSGNVVNQGQITAPNYAILLGKNVSNSGVIESARVALFAGKSVDVATTDGVVFRLNPQSSLNAGFVNEDGSLYQHVVNNSGRIQANSVTENVKGEVVLLAANGSASSDGLIQAAGGSVDVLGKTVSVAGTIDTDSAVGNGGSIRVGGDFKGKGLTPTAEFTVVAGTLKANGGDAGKGGSIVVWSNKDTSFTGRLLAAGGNGGGNAEISSKGLLGVSGYANVGESGSILFDPFDLNIKTGGGVDTTTTHFVDTDFIKTAVGNLDFQAQRDLSVNNAVSRDNVGNLTLTAGRNITINEGITTQGDTTLNANYNISVRNNAFVDSTGVTTLNARQNISIGSPTQTLASISGDNGVVITAKSSVNIPFVPGGLAPQNPAATSNTVNVWGQVSSANGDVNVTADDNLSVFGNGSVTTPNGSVFLTGNNDGTNNGTPEQTFISGNVISGQDISLSNEFVQIPGVVSANNGTVSLTADGVTQVVAGRPNGVLQGDALQLNIGNRGVDLPNVDFVSTSGTVAGDALFVDREALVTTGLMVNGTSTISTTGIGVTADNLNPEGVLPLVQPLATNSTTATPQDGLQASSLRNFAGPLSQRGTVSIQNNIGNVNAEGGGSDETEFSNNALTPTTNGNSFLPTL